MAEENGETDPKLQKLIDDYERVKASAAAAKARLDQAKARKTAAIRKYDAKRKIVAGGFLFRLAADGDESALAVMRKLYRHVHGETASAREADKRAFLDWTWPKPDKDSE